MYLRFEFFIDFDIVLRMSVYMLCIFCIDVEHSLFMSSMLFVFFFSSRRRHTRCALVTGVQTCALPIYPIDQIAAAKSAQKPGTRIDFIDHDDKAMLRAAREATRDLGTARAGIYWSDMLGSDRKSVV